MRALMIQRPGDAEVLAVVDLPRPEPAFGQVRVRVAAAGLNRADVLQRRGLYPAPPGVHPHVPGLEYSGEIDALGPGVDGVAVGDAVMGVVGGGACAEHLIVHHREVIRRPSGVDAVAAAAIPEAFMTAWDALILQGGLRAGQVVLIHAVGSGVGTAASQVAKAAGAFVIGTSRTAEKLARCGALGVDVTIETRDAEAAARAVKAAAPEGVDVVLDLVGAAGLPLSLSAVRSAGGGVIVCVGLVGGAQVELPLGVLLARRARLIGTVLRSRPLEEKIALARRFEREVVPGFERGALRPVLERALPLEAAAEAHRAMEANTIFGKIVLTL